jgi:CO/xanthine dehydrogenase Mo-binding subunit
MGLSILVADELGISPADVTFLYQDTDAAPFDLGSGGSQTTFNNGRAVVAAAEKLRQRLVDLAAPDLEADPADLELVDGTVRVKGAPDKSVTIGAMVGKAMAGGEQLVESGTAPQPPMPEGAGAGCSGRFGFPAFPAPTFFAHAVRVRVDRETGVVRVVDAAAGHDFGTVINPTGVEGQVLGGFVHGVGMALLEGSQLTEDGRQLNPHLLDYKLQTAADVPALKIAYVERPAPDGGPRGIKGVGEPPVTPTAAAIGNAIAQVIGARVYHLPMTPERVWTAMESEGTR